MTNAKICEMIPVARKTVVPAILKAVDNIALISKGVISFADVIDAVSIYVDEFIEPELFEAAKRVVESVRCITIEA